MEKQSASRRSHRRLSTLVFAVLWIALGASLLISAGVGQLTIPPLEVLGSLLHKVGITALPLPEHPSGDQTLWAIRFPRVAMAALVGAGLAVSGLLMQAIFGNPLAEPGVIGISAGAAVGAGIAIVFGITALGSWSTAALAFAFGL